MLRTDEILSTIEMLHAEHLDVRAVTLALNMDDCAASSHAVTCGTYYPWMLHDYSNMQAQLRGVAAGVRMAVLLSVD